MPFVADDLAAWLIGLLICAAQMPVANMLPSTQIGGSRGP